MSVFGFVHIKGEGAPIHPDDMGADLTHDQYLKQLKAYADVYGIERTKQEFCCNQKALAELLNNEQL